MYSLATPIVNWHEFLSDDLLEQARAIVRVNQDKFEPTSTTTGEADFRSSVVLWHWHYEEFKAKLVERVRQVLPDVQRLMQEYVPQTAPGQIEVQLTGSVKTGDKFRKHIDNGPPETATMSRRISCVIYFSMHDDNRFEGGDLIVHLNNGKATIKPIHNTVVFFPSHVFHEVEPIKSETNDFFDGRFTLNCWIHA